jgi:hypothetical protein
MVTITKTGKIRKQNRSRIKPGDARQERLVLRIHPDLMAVLIQRSRESGLTRSQYVERILVGYVVNVEGAELDAIGRRVVGPVVSAVADPFLALRRPAGAKPPLTYQLPPERGDPDARPDHEDERSDLDTPPEDDR